MAVAHTKVPLFKDPFWHFQIKIKFKKKSQGRAVSDYRTPDYQTLTSSGLFPALRFIHINTKIVSFKVVFTALLLVSKSKREHLLNKEKMFFLFHFESSFNSWDDKILTFEIFLKILRSSNAMSKHETLNAFYWRTWEVNSLEIEFA